MTTCPSEPAVSSSLRLLLVAGLVLVLLPVLAWYQRPDGYLHIFFLDTSGDAVLIQTPGGRHVLVDGGADPMQLALHLGQHLPFWKRSLDAVVLTRADETRLPGQVAALLRYRPALVLAPPALPASDAAREWARLLIEQRVVPHAAQPGSRLALDGALLSVLAADDGDEAGLVLRLDYGATSVVLNGAGSLDSDSSLLAQAAPITALAYPWQRELRTPLVAAWQPQAIIFTTARQDDHPALLTSYERALGSSSRYQHLYHPQRDGTIELVSDGQAACIRRAHEPPCMQH